MDTTGSVKTGSVKSMIFYGIIAILISLIAGFISYIIISRRKTVPSGNWEGFQGPSLGVSDISCGQESADAIAISDVFADKQSTTSDGPDDMREFKMILSKLCCMKHDLVSPSQVIDSTKKLPYVTSHDRDAVANTVARCFTKSVPMRDLDISFGTWKDRGDALLNKLCTSYNLSNDESERVRKFFKTCWMETFIVAKELCRPAEGKESVNPRDLRGLTPEKVKDLGAYTGYY
jgi:hypothetical protein